MVHVHRGLTQFRVHSSDCLRVHCLWYRYKWPDVYKTLIMDSFPPLDALDEREVSYETVDQMEGFLLKWLGVFDAHLKLANRGEGSEGFLALPRRAWSW